MYFSTEDFFITNNIKDLIHYIGADCESHDLYCCHSDDIIDHYKKINAIEIFKNEQNDVIYKVTNF